MKKSVCILNILLFSVLVDAQDVFSIWNQVIMNNLTLQAAQQQCSVQKIDTRVGLMPVNPEVEFAYLWGTPTAVGNRVDISVTQTFEFPTVYVYRHRIADLQAQKAELAYLEQQRELLLQVGKLYYEIVYQNVRIHDMEHCLQILTKIVAAYQQQLEKGTISIFEYNKVKLAELNLQQEKAHAEAEYENMLLELKQLNGGKEIAVVNDHFSEFVLPSDFEEWFQRVTEQHPTLLWLNKEEQFQEQQVKLSKSMWAPQFVAGYMREQIPAETFQGLKVGLSLPLWNNANSVKKAKLQRSATHLMAIDQQQKIYNELKKHYLMIEKLQQQIADYQQLIETVDATELLSKALDTGQISLVDYLFELSMYHESHERLAEIQRDVAQHYVVLQLWEH